MTISILRFIVKKTKNYHRKLKQRYMEWYNYELWDIKLDFKLKKY